MNSKWEPSPFSLNRKVQKTLRRYDTGLISAYEAYCLIREHSPEVSEAEVIFLIIGGKYDFSFVVVV